MAISLPQIRFAANCCSLSSSCTVRYLHNGCKILVKSVTVPRYGGKGPELASQRTLWLQASHQRPSKQLALVATPGCPTLGCCTSPRVPLPPGWPRLTCRAVEPGKLRGGSGTSPFSCTSPPARLRKVQPSSSALQPGCEVST